VKEAFGRLSKAPHPELHRLVYAPAFARDVRDVLPLLVRVNAAHVVMLEQSGLVDRTTAAALLRAGDAIAASPPSMPEAHRGLYAVFEAELAARCGPGVGGSAHAARSRNDINATTARMRVRECLIAVAEDLFGLRAALLERAAEHRATLMPGFTHLQPAQPTTLGHYLLGVAAELDRAGDRLLDIERRLDACPMGACAGFGTSFAIRADLVAELLGFSGPAGSSVDAVASRDFVVDFLSAAALTGATLTRLATDLQQWGSAAWRCLDWPDDLMSTSSIMPQKRNAFVLETIRVASVTASGEWVAAIAGLKNTPFGNGIEVSMVVERALAAATDTATALELTTLLIRHMEVDVAAFERATEAGDITATALADALVRRHGIAFRAAHEAVAALVSSGVERTRPAAVAAYLQRALDRAIDPADVAVALDPRAAAAAAAFGGGPAAVSLARQHEALQGSLSDQRARIGRIAARDAAARQRLRAEIDRLLTEAP
jgi:argininosuccinate lyase